METKILFKLYNRPFCLILYIWEVNAKETLTEVTSELIRNKGYYGTGINEILAGAGIPKGSLYHHFPGGKDELIEAALKQAALQYAGEFKNAMKGKGSAVEGLKSVVDVYIDKINKTNDYMACPLAAVSLDVSGQNEKLRLACESMFEFWILVTTAYLEYKNVKKSREKAESFMIRLEGAILLSQVQRSARPFELIKRELQYLINRN